LSEKGSFEEDLRITKKEGRKPSIDGAVLSILSEDEDKEESSEQESDQYSIE
jgi:hypothetical protein